jgi:hypothetical protein
LIGYQAYEDIVPDYTYWNAGLTLGFMERWSADIRYWDTNYSDAECFINSGGVLITAMRGSSEPLRPRSKFQNLPKALPTSRAPSRRPFFFAGRMP